MGKKHNILGVTMLFNVGSGNVGILAVISLLVVTVAASAEEEIVDLEFRHPPVSSSDSSRTLQSLVKVQGTGRFCQDGLYLMTHFGDLEGAFIKENQALIDEPFINQTWRFCSVFSVAGENSVKMGRNWDNQNVGSIIISLYHPTKGYSSISFCRSIDLGFGHKDLAEFQSSIFAGKLLLAPFYAMDGMNEHGLAVAVAANEDIRIEPSDGRERVFITFLIRKVLDGSRTVDEAVRLVEKCTPFLLDRNSLSGHLFIVDSSCRSVILEYDRDQWRKTYGDKAWQIMTTKPVYNVPDASLRERCWRYRIISEALENTTGELDRNKCAEILKDVAQKGTTWSVVYCPVDKELYFSVYQQWDTIYRLKMQAVPKGRNTQRHR
jgi:hypothetical protein